MMSAAEYETYCEALIDAAPPLSDAQIRGLQFLLHPEPADAGAVRTAGRRSHRRPSAGARHTAKPRERVT
jgi:hypothetical protein